MKMYMAPSVEIALWEQEDIITLSVGTSNDNDYSDIDWGE